MRQSLCSLGRAPLIAFLLGFAIQSQTIFAASPKGVLIYGRGGDSVSLDPAKETDGESLNVCDNIFDTLVRFKEGSTDVEPGLAKRWEVSADGLTYTFYLRDQVKFHDGTEMNADAVVFSFLRQHDPKHEAHGFAQLWSYWQDMGMDKLVKSIAKVDNTTVRIQLNAPSAPFLANLAMNFASIVSPAAVRKFKQEFARNPVGTGPFKFVSWTKNEKIILNAFSDFWDTKPKIARVIFKSYPDSATRLNAFLAGEIHMMNLPTPDQVAVIRKKKPNAVILEEPAMNVAYLAFNTTKGPFAQPKVRQALNMAVNKAAIIKGVYAGMGVPAVNPIPPSLWSYNTKIKPYGFDRQRAKQLLAEAGYPKGFTSELFYLPVSRPYMPDAKRVAEAIQADFKAVGVNVQLTTHEWAVYLDKTKKGEHPMALMGWTGDNGDPDNFLSVLLSGDNAKAPASNIAFYDNRKVTQILRDAQRVTVQQKRSDMYQTAQKLIHEDAPWIPIAHSRVAMPMDVRVKGFTLQPNGSRRFDRVSLEGK
jgi:peptide/nickel transport system substrate-binding protein